MNKRRHNKKGRGSNGLASFVALERYLLDSRAWLSLTPVARSAYVELARCYDGSNNGRIQMSARILGSRLGMGKTTASRALDELVEKGFIQVGRKSNFSQKLKTCSEYALAAFRNDVNGDLPSKKFMHWRPQIQNSVPQVEPHGATGGTESIKPAQNSAAQFHRKDRGEPKPPLHGSTGGPLLYSNHTAPATSTVNCEVEGAANQRAGDLQPMLNSQSESEALRPISDILDLSNLSPQKHRSNENAA